jgi:hypothetical protein
MTTTIEEAWPELVGGRVVFVDATVLPMRMLIGYKRAEVVLRIDLPDKTTVLVTTTRQGVINMIEAANPMDGSFAEE